MSTSDSKNKGQRTDGVLSRRNDKRAIPVGSFGRRLENEAVFPIVNDDYSARLGG